MKEKVTKALYFTENIIINGKLDPKKVHSSMIFQLRPGEIPSALGSSESRVAEEEMITREQITCKIERVSGNYLFGSLANGNPRFLFQKSLFLAQRTLH